MRALKSMQIPLAPYQLAGYVAKGGVGIGRTKGYASACPGRAYGLPGSVGSTLGKVTLLQLPESVNLQTNKQTNKQIVQAAAGRRRPPQAAFFWGIVCAKRRQFSWWRGIICAIEVHADNCFGAQFLCTQPVGGWRRPPCQPSAWEVVVGKGRGRKLENARARRRASRQFVLGQLVRLCLMGPVALDPPPHSRDGPSSTSR